MVLGASDFNGQNVILHGQSLIENIGRINGENLYQQELVRRPTPAPADGRPASA